MGAYRLLFPLCCSPCLDSETPGRRDSCCGDEARSSSMHISVDRNHRAAQVSMRTWTKHALYHGKVAAPPDITKAQSCGRLCCTDNGWTRDARRPIGCRAPTGSDHVLSSMAISSVPQTSFISLSSGQWSNPVGAQQLQKCSSAARPCLAVMVEDLPMEKSGALGDSKTSEVVKGPGDCKSHAITPPF